MAQGSACAASIQNNDIARLMYYLFCATKGCGLNILSNELVDFNNTSMLKKQKHVDAVLMAALQYSPEHLVGKCMFLQNGFDVCGDNANMFLPITRAQEFVNPQSTVRIGGKELAVTSVLVFKKDWLLCYYRQPLEANKSRVKRLQSRVPPSLPVGTTCPQCAQAISLCLCSKSSENLEEVVPSSVKFMKRQSRTSSAGSSSGSGRIFSLLGHQSPSLSPQQSHSDVANPSKMKSKKKGTPKNLDPTTKHCKHCSGEKLLCACVSQCPLRDDSTCFKEHPGVTCNSCGKTPIRGSRLKCAVCLNYELCGVCYNRNHVHLTHPFRHILRPGTMYTSLPKRATKEPQQENVLGSGTRAQMTGIGGSKHCMHCMGGVGDCKCIYGCAVPQEGRCHGVHDIQCVICTRVKIYGSLFKCRICIDTNLCQSCYEVTGGGQAHLGHDFWQYTRKGVVPVVLPPRAIPQRALPSHQMGTPRPPMSPPSPISPAFGFSPVSLSSSSSPPAPLSSFSLPQSDAPFSPGVVHHGTGFTRYSPGGHADLALSEVSGSEKGVMMTDSMTITQMIAYLRTHGEKVSGTESADELRRRVWDCHIDSIDVAELSRLLVNLGLNDVGLSVVQRREHGKAAYSLRYHNISSAPLASASAAPIGSALSSNHDSDSIMKSGDFNKGDRVSLHGLRTASYRNGMQGVIVDGMLNQGRMNVRMDEDDTIVCAKLENLTLEAQVVD